MALVHTRLLPLLLLASMPWLAGQEGCNPDPDPETCFFQEPATFSSVEQHECGLGPDGPVLCNWRLSFNGGEFQWMHSDVGEVGKYTCEGSSVIGDTGYATYSGKQDPATGLLIWEGVAYQPG